MTEVDVVVVTHNTRGLVLRCVRSVLAAGKTGLGIRCVVVDNASSDGTAEAIEAAYPEVDVVRNAENAGYGTACNRGLARGRSPYVLILNSDVLARPGAVSRLVEFLESSPAHVAAGGRLVDPGTTRVQVGHNVRAFPRIAPQAALILGLERWWPRNPLSRRHAGLDLDYERTQDVDQPAGACLACRRSAFEAIGGFDEAFYYWYEDVDLVRRLRDRGRIAYVHDAVFDHVKSATFAQWGRPEAMVSWYWGMFRYFEKHRPRTEWIGVRALAAVVALVRAAIWMPYRPEWARGCLIVTRLAVRGRG